MPRRHGGGSGSYYDEEKAAQSPHALLQAPLLLRMEQGNDEEEHNGLERDQEIARAPSCGASTAQCLIWARRKLLGYVVLLLLGLVLGLALPKNKQLQHDPASAALSNILGWTYFLAWTVSFYPQLLLNYRQQTTEGLSLDFELLNFLGFLFYTAFALALQTAPSIQQAYRNQNDGHENKVTIQDVVFAGHAVLITAVTIAQMFYYDGFDPKRKRLSRPISLVVLGLLATTVLALTVAGARGAKPSDWLDFLYILSYMKLFITIIKGIPQAYLNYIRKSTSGWSIHNILCDFTGRCAICFFHLSIILSSLFHPTCNIKILSSPSVLFYPMFQPLFTIPHLPKQNRRPLFGDATCGGLPSDERLEGYQWRPSQVLFRAVLHGLRCIFHRPAFYPLPLASRCKGTTEVSP